MKAIMSLQRCCCYCKLMMVFHVIHEKKILMKLTGSLIWKKLKYQMPNKARRKGPDRIIKSAAKNQAATSAVMWRSLPICQL